jgi:hypothetical protein
MFENYRYVFAATMSITPSDKFVCGWVEVGGDPANIQGRWVYVVRTDKRKGLFTGYSIMEDAKYPGPFKEVGRAFTLFSARKIVEKRVIAFAEDFSEKHDLPIVNFEERCRLQEGAGAIAVEKLSKSYR